MKWIEVEDRLPEYEDDGSSAIVAVIMGKYHSTKRHWEYRLAWLENGKWYDQDATIYYDNGIAKIRDIEDNPDYYSVTHWMPLPEPPKDTAKTLN